MTFSNLDASIFYPLYTLNASLSFKNLFLKISKSGGEN